METMICEAPMSYTGAFKRTQLWLSGIGNDFGRKAATVGMLVFWWLFVSVWYMLLIYSILPIIWTYPYRMMRRRQRSERYTRTLAARMTIAQATPLRTLADDYTTSMPAIPKND